MIFDRVVPVDRFLLAGIVIVVAAALAALFRWTPFGLSTRAASENEVSAMLAGLSPSRLAVANTVLASVVAGGLGVLVAPLIALDAQTLAFQVVPALAAALLAGFTSFFVACFAGLAIGVIQSLLIYWATQSWFPTDTGGAPLRGLPELFVFLVIVLALFLRGASLPGRGELRRTATPGRAPARAAAPADGDRRGRRRGLPDRLPVRLPAGADQLAARRRHLPLARRHRRLRRPDLGRAARARRRRRLHDVAPDDRRRRHLGGVPDLAPDRRGDGHGRRAARRGLGAAGPRGQSRGRHARGRRRARAVRLPERALGRRGQGVARPAAGARGARSVSPRALQGPGRQAPEPGVRLPRPRCDARPLHARRQRAAREPGTADARRALQRACRGGSRDQRPQHEARRVRHRRVHRRDGRCALRVQLRVGQLQPLRGPGGARPDRVRLLRGHHHGLRGNPRGRRRDRGALPPCLRPVVRPVRKLGAADRRLRVDRHLARQPGGHRRHRIQEEAAEERRLAAEAAADTEAPRTPVPPARRGIPQRPRARRNQRPPSSPRPGSRSPSAACGRSTTST